MNQELNAIEKAKIRLAAIKADREAYKAKQEAEVAPSRVMEIPSLIAHGLQYDTSVAWNAKQLDAINAVAGGKSFCLIGPAGSGKTTTEKGIVYTLLKNNMVPMIVAGKSTKWLPAGSPGIAMVSFTNMAVRQTAKHFSGDVNCITIHKLLEFAPVWYETTGDDGKIIRKMQFEPTRNKNNPLPRELKIIIVDESSMVDCDLFNLLLAALPDISAVQFIFLGDLNQLPPVYGGPILGKKLLELPIVELTEIYRQAMLSPIIRFALNMKDGKGIDVKEKLTVDEKEHGCVVIQPWTGSLGWEDALHKAQNFCKGAIETGALDVMQDIILCPYNVNFGVLELNHAISDYLGRKRGAIVHEVIAGFETRYLAVGDKMLVQKREAIITKITRNGNYLGKPPMDVSKFKIDRNGGATRLKGADGLDASKPALDFSDPDFDVDSFLDGMQTTDVQERKNQASHRITVGFIDAHEEWNPDAEDLETMELSSAGEVNEMLFGYAITVHKSQGSEWRRVFLITHKSHAKMCSRELMYTAMTRAKEHLHIICEPDRVAVAGTLNSAARKPRLKGNTLAEKLVSLKQRFDEEARTNASKQKEEEND